MSSSKRINSLNSSESGFLQVSAGILSRAWHFHLARIKTRPALCHTWLVAISEHALSDTPYLRPRLSSVLHSNPPLHPPLFNAQLDRRLDKGERGHTRNVKGPWKVNWIVSISPVLFSPAANLLELFFLNVEATAKHRDCERAASSFGKPGNVTFPKPCWLMLVAFTRGLTRTRSAVFWWVCDYHQPLPLRVWKIGSIMLQTSRLRTQRGKRLSACVESARSGCSRWSSPLAQISSFSNLLRKNRPPEYYIPVMLIQLIPGRYLRRRGGRFLCR